MTSTDKLLEELVIQAKALGFDHVDIYVPDKKSGDVVAFTFSKSEAYIAKIQKIEMIEVRYYKGKYRVEMLEPSQEMRNQMKRQVKVLESFTSWELTIHGLDFSLNRERKQFEVGEVFTTAQQNLKKRISSEF